jgi:hypothetical protein
LLKYDAYDEANNQITFKKDSSSGDVKKKICIPFGVNLASDNSSAQFIEKKKYWIVLTLIKD